MHGTVEWLPGNPLGNTPESWPDTLIGDIPNLYIYAANNPSESILAKRRGYATIISHNVPPYARAGLYSSLKQLKELIVEYKIVSQKTSMSDSSANLSESDSSSSASMSGSSARTRMGASVSDSNSENSGTTEELVLLMVSVLDKCGMFSDLPFTLLSTASSAAEAAVASPAVGEIPYSTGTSSVQFPINCDVFDENNVLVIEKIQTILQQPSTSSYSPKTLFLNSFAVYITKLNEYLIELEQKLFSAGLYEIGATATVSQIEGYLSALVNETKLPGLANIESLNRIAQGVMENQPSSTVLLQLMDPRLTGK